MDSDNKYASTSEDNLSNSEEKKVSNKAKLKYYHKIKNIKIICDVCGGKYDMYHKSAHYNTKKHKEYITITKYIKDLSELQQQINIKV